MNAPPSCDFTTLANLDAGDPEQVMQVVDACTRALSDPRLWIWAILLTVVGAVVGALIGRYKQAVVRDTILGAALGPIGWVVSLLLPKPTAQPRCAACGRNVDRGDAHCRHCGAALSGASRR